MRYAAILVVLAGVVPHSGAAAQRRLTLTEAVDRAREYGPAASLARADSILARAGLTSARAFPDPVLSAGYTEDVPRYHAELEQAFDVLSRGPRQRAARADTRTIALRRALTYATIRRDVTVAYTEALGLDRHVHLSERALADAEELVRIATVRRDAGDASDLDVALARLNAGDLRNRLISDSTERTNALVALQLLLGEDGTAVSIELTDSLEQIDAPAQVSAGTPLLVAAAEAENGARTADLSFRLRQRVPVPMLRAGFDASDPATGESRLLPTIGIAFSLPLFDANRGAVAEARAGVARSSFELASARRESDAAIAKAQRERSAAAARLDRDRTLLADAEQIAGLAGTAYREGAYPLASVLEAQRTVREALSRTIDDLASFIIACADLTLATETR